MSTHWWHSCPPSIFGLFYLTATRPAPLSLLHLFLLFLLFRFTSLFLIFPSQTHFSFTHSTRLRLITMATTSAVHTQESTPAASSTDDSRHIYTVAAKSLQDCVELLQSLKAAMAVEAQEAQEAQEQEQQRLQRQINGNHKNDTPVGKSMRDIHHMSRSASQEAEQDPDNSAAAGTGSAVSKPPRAASSLPQAITPCPRSEMYTKPSVLACQGTIGKHVRHLHDHYRLLLATFPPAQVKKKTPHCLL